MPADDADRPVACTITEARAAQRAGWMREALVPRFLGGEPRDDGVTVRFEGTEETLRHVARFVAEEQACCAFADYRIDVAPPYEETRLTITGPEGTREMFATGLLPRLRGEEPMDSPS